MAMTAAPRIVAPKTAAFVTIGQTPRLDMVPEMRAEILAGLPEDALTITEFGVLDGKDEAALAGFAARDGQPTFVTRLNDGREIAVDVAAIEAGLNRLLADIDGRFDLIVLLCTGTRIAPLAKSLVVEAQRVVDANFEAIGASAQRLGVLLPLQRQVDEFGQRHVFSRPVTLAAASPYGDGDFEAAGEKLAGCDLVVMHCMGFSAAMAARMRGHVRAPILVSRRVVSAAVRQLIQ